MSPTDQGKTGSLPDEDLSAAFSGAAAAALAPRRRNRRGGGSATPADSKTAVTEEPKEEESANEEAPPAQAPETNALEERAEPQKEAEELPADPPKQSAPVPPPAVSTEDAASAEPKPSADLVFQMPAPVETPQPRDVSAVQIRNLGEPGQRATQCTIMVSSSVRDRFAHYQLTKKMQTGKEPTNAIVVRRAVLHARKNDLFAQLLEKVRHQQQPVEDEDHDPDGLFGEVPGRRAERGRMKDSLQQSFRPSYQELEVIDAITKAYGFPSRSDFLDAALDAFLPALPASGKTRGR